MNILVTGGAGFIGRHVCAELIDHGHDVTAFDCLDKRIHPTGSWVDVRLPPRVQCYNGHAGDLVDMERVLARRVDALIHLAAAVSVADSAKWPCNYIDANSFQTASLLDSLRRRPVKRLVVASSMSVYGEGSPAAGTPESAPCLPASVYGLTKFDQERLCLILGEQAGIPTMALRLFNVYGPGQSTTNKLTGVLANWAGAILRGERPVVCEDGQQSRDFVFVRDVARAFRLAVESDRVGVVNIGTGVATTLCDAAAMLTTAFGRPDLQPTITGEKRPGDIRHCVADAGRADEWLDWRARTTFAEGLAIYADELTTFCTPG